ncbi:sugar phosphate isomerase/epimerase family protein [Flavobacterium algicola]|uniref:sugar phosphate isomerase/epimerase family protein n=1 Tax=Flavobacterium algicola TaxID=556529 RepID=UPI001EFD78C4|nr:TIM barrel protein [Flavobacterium algicola]MCG9792935.1 sugar phosphate isomerase/epimerase [Flavobacterium algicola]
MSTRREFISKSACAAGMLPLSTFSFPSIFDFDDHDVLDVSIFSKHLQFLDYKATGEIAAEMGFAGVDLTVRPNGHVLPERAKLDLPLAIDAIRKSSVHCKMITTTVESVNNPIDIEVLEAAAAAKVNFYRTNWFKYKDNLSMQDSLIFYQEEIRKLGDINKNLGLVGSYQNVDGVVVGSSFWEVKKIMETVNPNYFGSQFDIRHAVVEGGNSWENAFRLLKEDIKIIVLKDFKWGKVNGKWEAINVPIGEGMVDFTTYFKLLKKNNLKPPVSLHIEYDLGGAEQGIRTITVDKKVVFDAIKKDLKSIQKLWKEA